MIHSQSCEDGGSMYALGGYRVDAGNHDGQRAEFKVRFQLQMMIVVHRSSYPVSSTQRGDLPCEEGGMRYRPWRLRASWHQPGRLGPIVSSVGPPAHHASASGAGHAHPQIIFGSECHGD